MLNTRHHEAVTDWLKQQPSLKLITRDGSKSYARAVQGASPLILQVADRWHIFQQLFEAVKKATYATVPSKWIADPINEETNKDNVKIKISSNRKSEQNRNLNEEKRWLRIQQVQSLHSTEYNVTQIATKLGISRGTVYSDLRQTHRPDHQRYSPYKQFTHLVQALVKDGQSFKMIERRCRSDGYGGSSGTLSNMIAQAKNDIKRQGKQSYSFRQKILTLLWNTNNENRLSEIQSLHPKLLVSFPFIETLQEYVHSFRRLFTKCEVNSLHDWLEEHRSLNDPHLQSFMNGVRQDFDAIQLGIQEQWSNGPTEGHVNRLKTIKRMMYGRAGFEVLKNRFLYRL